MKIYRKIKRWFRWRLWKRGWRKNMIPRAKDEMFYYKQVEKGFEEDPLFWDRGEYYGKYEKGQERRGLQGVGSDKEN